MRRGPIPKWAVLWLLFSPNFSAFGFQPILRHDYSLGVQQSSLLAQTQQKKSKGRKQSGPNARRGYRGPRGGGPNRGRKGGGGQQWKKTNKNTRRAERAASPPSSKEVSPIKDEPAEQKDIGAYFSSKLSEMHEWNSKGMNLTQSYCDSVLGLCVAADEWDSVLEVMEVMKSQGLSQKRSTYRACLQSCFEFANGPSSSEILNAMKAAQFEPDPIDVSLVVATMCKQQEEAWWKRALSLLKSTAYAAAEKAKEESKERAKEQKLDSKNAGPDGAYEEVLSGLVDSKSWKDPENVVPSEAYDAVLSCMVKSKNWKDAVRLLHLMEQKNNYHPAPVLSTFRLVIENCVNSYQGEQAFQVLMSMSKRGLKPTVYTFELIISALAQKLQWRRALQLLDMMDEMHVQKTVIIYNTVISACAKAGEVGAAMNLLRKMRKAGVKPDIFSFNSVMTACASTSRWRDALTILDQCHREPGVEPDIITYTNAIRACTRGGKTSQALSILQVVKDRKIPLDSYAYTAAIDACAKGRMWQRALDLLGEMEENGVTPNSITYSVTITACGNGGQWEKALELLTEMKEKDMKINLITYNAGITALSKASRRFARRSTKEHAPLRFSKGMERNDVLDIDEQQLWTRALMLIKQMKDDGLEPDGFSYSAAISCCGAGGRWEEALALIKRMQRGGPRTRPNKIAYTAAISACGRSGKHEEALQLFTDMKDQGLQPDRVAYNAVLSALRVANMPDKALELWREMIGKKSAKSTKIASAKADSSLSPDIITVTDVIAALGRSGGAVSMEIVDTVFKEAVERGFVLNRDTLDSHYEIDLSGMTFPVARAAVRFVLNRAKGDSHRGAVVEDITFITGVGRAQFFRSASKEDLSTDEQPESSMSLREYVQDVLVNDFNPSIQSSVPSLAQGTVEVPRASMKAWIKS